MYAKGTKSRGEKPDDLLVFWCYNFRMNGIFLAALLFFTVSCFAAPTLADERRVALIIGNSAYQSVPILPNPKNDAADISAALERLGFDVMLETDQNFRDLRLSLRDFATKSQGADIALIYYAGHGIEVDKRNYLIPIDARLASDADVLFETISLDTMLSAVSAAKGVKVVLLDACRNNPFRGQMTRTVATRSLGRGLTEVDPGGVLVGYAAREGTEALDGTGRNSPYAKALLQHIEEPGLEIGRLFRKVRDSVYDATNGQQEPYTYGSLPGRDIYLAGLAAPQIKESVSQPAPSPAQDKLVQDFALAEKLNTSTSWARFLDQHAESPDHPLIAVGQRRLSAIDAELSKRRAIQDRKPWLSPAAGLKAYGALELNKSERRLIQSALNLAGFDVGGIDGEFGPRTLAAITGARFAAGLPSGSFVDASLLKVLPDATKIALFTTGKVGRFKVEDVKELREPRLTKAIESLPYDEVVFDYYKGNLYIAVLGGTGWSSAEKVARKAGGHLAVINDAAENAFLYSLFSRDPRFIVSYGKGHYHGPSFGLFQRQGAAEPRGGWTWVTGQPLNYQNWSPYNPDNFRGRQRYGSFFVNKQDRARGHVASKWDDTSGVTTGFIIEID